MGEEKPTRAFPFMAGVVVFELLCFILWYLVLPTYVLPMFYKPLGITILVLAFLIQAIAIKLLLKGEFGPLKAISLIVFFILPICSLPFFVPAVITISDAIGNSVREPARNETSEVGQKNITAPDLVLSKEKAHPLAVELMKEDFFISSRKNVILKAIS